MLRYLTKRILISLLIVWVVLSATFVLMHVAPGDPSMLYIQPEIDQKVVANIRNQLGFDLPVWKQYFQWMRNFIQGNFGFSFTQHRPVKDVLFEAIPNTIRLTFSVIVFQFVIGICLGIFCAIKRNSRVDSFINAMLLFLYSMPGFWLSLIAIMVFSLYLGWLPSSQMNSLFPLDGFWMNLWDQIKHLILPVSILSIPFLAYTTRFVRDKLSGILQEPYILAARASGLNERTILFKYALKNALLPLVTILGLFLPFLLGGAVITEYIFAWPGIGRITVNAIFTYDYPLILASNFLAALAVILGNLISDILYLFADPRIRLAGKI